jgi:hypothetical protein
LTKDYPWSFEFRFLTRLKDMIAALPLGSATLETGPDTSLVNFVISPTNPGSAAIRGSAATQQGICVTIGQSAYVELSEKRKGEDRFFAICKSIFTAHSTERVVCDRQGRVLYSKIVLPLGGRQIQLRDGWIFWWARLGRSERRFSYEPYYKVAD